MITSPWLHFEEVYPLVSGTKVSVFPFVFLQTLVPRLRTNRSCQTVIFHIKIWFFLHYEISKVHIN